MLSTQSWCMMCLAAFVRASSLPLPANVNSQFILVSRVCACRGWWKSKSLHMCVGEREETLGGDMYLQSPLKQHFHLGFMKLSSALSKPSGLSYKTSENCRFTTKPIDRKGRMNPSRLGPDLFWHSSCSWFSGLPDHSSPGISNKPISEPFLK